MLGVPSKIKNNLSTVASVLRACTYARYSSTMARQTVNAMYERPPWGKPFDAEVMEDAYVSSLTKQLNQEVFLLDFFKYSTCDGQRRY